MHCPNCGVKATAGQKFCRTCGFGLEKFAHLFAEEMARAEQLPNDDVPPFDERLRKLERLAVMGLFSLGSILGALMLWAIIYKALIVEGKVVGGAIILMILAFLSLFGLLGYLDAQRKKAPVRPPTKPLTLPPGEETAKILPAPQVGNVVSIAEHTTARLQEKVEQPR